MEEVQSTMLMRFGFTLQPDIAEIAAESWMTDLLVQRTHSYKGEPRLPGRTLVISWDQDVVVPHTVVNDESWAECGEVEHHLVPGDHREYLRGPQRLVGLIEAEMVRA